MAFENITANEADQESHKGRDEDGGASSGAREVEQYGEEK